MKSGILEPFTIHANLDVAYANSERDALRIKYESYAVEITRSLQDSCDKFNIHVIQSCPLSIVSNGEPRPVLNMSLTEGLGLLTTRCIMTLEKVGILVRNQHIRDTRPNKRLDPQINDYLFRGSKHHALIGKDSLRRLRPSSPASGTSPERLPKDPSVSRDQHSSSHENSFAPGRTTDL